jgi:REP element-mobilizing transposase RayT
MRADTVLRHFAPYDRTVPLPLRDESPGYHHVVTRGNNKRRIYADDRDRIFFCLTVQRVARKYGWTVLAYCLMDNHYHLLLLVGERGLAAGMCELNTSYARTFNVTHGRVNHLFGRRYWNRRIRSEASLVAVARYIVRNPRRAGITDRLDGYRWSSYAATIGVAFADMQLAREQLLGFFGSRPQPAVDSFRLFCEDVGGSEPVRWQPP